MRVNLGTVLAFSLVLNLIGLVGCQNDAQTVRLFESDDPDSQLANGLAKFIIVNGFSEPVEVVRGKPEDAAEALRNDKADIALIAKNTEGNTDQQVIASGSLIGGESHQKIISKSLRERAPGIAKFVTDMSIPSTFWENLQEWQKEKQVGPEKSYLRMIHVGQSKVKKWIGEKEFERVKIAFQKEYEQNKELLSE